MMSSRRRPKMSPIRPKVISSEAKTRAYTELIHSGVRGGERDVADQHGKDHVDDRGVHDDDGHGERDDRIAFQRFGFSVDSTVEGGGASVTVGSLFSRDIDTDSPVSIMEAVAPRNPSRDPPRAERTGMPKISAPTVAEHRVRQRDALLHAATELLVDGGVSAVTPAAVGPRQGSPDQVCTSTSPAAPTSSQPSSRRPSRGRTRLCGSLSNRPTVLPSSWTPTCECRCASRTRVPTDPRRRSLQAQLPDECMARLRELHHEQAAPFLRALKELGTPELQLTAQLLGGVLEAAMGAIESGASLTAVTERALTLVRAAVGVAALA